VASEVLAGPRRRLQVVAGAWALIDLEADPADTPPLRDAQLFAGYAGWGPGQLQAELRSGSWWVVASHAGDLRLVRELDQVSAWRAVLGRQNSDLKFAATFPADPAHN
jgi:putative transcriptional regulator